MGAMRIAVTGSSGLIGSALVPTLRGAGHDVVRMVRRAPRAADERSWNPDGEPDAAPYEDVDAVVHLAGLGVGEHRWSRRHKRALRQSRVVGTTTLARSLARCDKPPAVLLSGSAIGWYGDTGERAVDESAPVGDTFLAHLCRDWEAATEPAAAAGTRVAMLRSGVVLTSRGGVIGQLLPIFRLGLGGKLGNGRQYVSFISIADEVGAIRHLLGADVSGPVNLTAPLPVTNAELTRELGAVLRRPARLTVPAAAMRVAVGEMSSEALRSQRVLPRRLTESGYDFQHPDLASALRAILT